MGKQPNAKTLQRKTARYLRKLLKAHQKLNKLADRERGEYYTSRSIRGVLDRLKK